MKIKAVLLLLAIGFTAPKKMSRSYVLSLIQAQKFSKEISRNRYILVNSMNLKFDVYFEFSRRGFLTKIISDYHRTSASLRRC